MSEPIVLLFATRNRGKVAELVELTRALPLEVRSLEGYDVPETVEDAPDFVGNAIKKALDVSRATGLPALADDSGLEVDALGGAPGVFSARYAGSHGDDAANNTKLLREMINKDNRRARFRSALALADHAGRLGERTIVAEGAVEGEILPAARGKGGFGYDPLFFCPELGLSFAEAGLGAKSKVSHRARAMACILLELIGYFSLISSSEID